MSLKSPGFDFASRDYENIRRDLLNRAAVVAPDWTDRDPSDFGVLLVDIWAYMGDVLHYYIDRAAGEAFITTATQRESMLALANLFDYTPYSRRAAVATVTVYNSSTESASLPSNTVFVGSSESGNYNFYSSTEAVIPPGASVQVTVTEGSKIVEEVLTNNSSGRPNQRYSLSKLNAVASGVQVYVYEDGVTPTQWNRVVDISTANTRTSTYSTSVSADNVVQVLFGNALSGRIPPTNSKITATYSITSGEAGNMPAKSITSFRNSQPAGLAVVDSTAATGGNSGESIESIKASLKSTIKSQDRAVTLNDFVDLAKRISGVFVATAKYEPSPEGGGSVTIYGMPYISDYPSYNTDSVAVLPEVQEQIVTNIQPMAMLGITVYAANSITLVPQTISATIYVDESYVASSVKRAVYDAISILFDLGSLQFGQSIKIGDVYKTIHSVEGVIYAEVTMTGAETLLPDQLVRRGNVVLETSGGITTSV